MASAVAELEAGLQAMSHLKAPGVSGSRINSLTALCVANVQSESVLIQKIYTHFKKTAADHKLGVLYVVDAVTRKWLEQAKSQGQPVDGSAPDGTFAAGVHRVTELIPVLMNDMIQSVPDAQKEKISKLLDIWEKGQTFPQGLIDSFRTKLSESSVKSTTPDGSPPPGLAAMYGYGGANANKPAAPTTPASADAPPNSNAIMEALANIARQNNTTTVMQPAPALASAPVAPAQPPPAAQTDLSSLLKSLSQHQAPAPASGSTPPVYAQQQPPVPAMNTPGMPFYPPQATGNFGGGNGNVGGYPGMPQMPQAAPAAGFTPDVQQQVILIKALAEQGVPLDKIPALVQSMQAAGMMAGSGTAAQQSYPTNQNWTAGGDSRGYGQGRQSPNSNRNHGRSRSRSPGARWESRDSYRGGRDDYRHDDRNGGGAGRNGRGSSEYRQRSPAGRRGRSQSPLRPPQHDGRGPKWVEHDPKLPQGHIRVFSRTLFVGGVTCSEQEIRGIFGRYGEVQTCIVNRDKRHAFVKMMTRRDAESAKTAMENQQPLNGLHLRTRWGVGFGPRDCSDYATGVSIIPITSLTDADRKWMLSAEFGGSGGRPIETGLVVEEPDIEIGAGVSSKAISRRMQTDKGGSHGPKSTRGDDRWQQRGGGGGGVGGGRGRRDDGNSGHPNAATNNNNNNNTAAVSTTQPVTQQFPYGISTMPNGMPNFPPGFSFPAPDA